MSRARRASLLPWLPFALVVLVHLGAKAVGLDELDRGTKPLLMVALAVPIVVLGRRDRPLVIALLLGGVLFSWLGDITLHWFVVGLAFFLVAHLVYIGMFAATFRRRPSWWGLAYLVWFVVFLAILAPSLGAYLVPVAVYGLALGAMGAAATRGNVLTTLGAALFVLSDSLLAFRLFTESMQGVVADIVIMALYLAAQTLLVLGVLRRRHP